MLLRKLLGHDIFISYSRADKDYAKKLKDQLSDMDYTCFIDYEKVFPGDRLSGALKRAIRWSSVFVLVGTDNSRNSKYVTQEVDEFLKTGRAMVPIFLGVGLAKSEWAVIHDNELVWVDEPNTKAPSPVVFEEINRLFRRNTVKVWRRTAGTALALVLLGLSVFATLQAREARKQQGLAEQKTLELEKKQRELEVSTAELTKQQEFLKKQNEELEQKTKEAKESAEKARQQQLLARQNADKAKEQGRIANERQRVAFSRELASNAVAQLQVDPELSVMLAAKAIGVDPNAQSEVALRRSLAESRLRGIVRGDVNGSALSTDGRLLATVHGRSPASGLPRSDNVLRVQEVSTGRIIAELNADQKPMYDPIFSPDGRLLAAACGEEVCLFNVATWDLLKKLPGRTVYLTSIRFSHDSKLVITGDYGNTVRAWEIATGRMRATLGPLKETVKDLQFSPDDKLFLAITEPEVVVAKADSDQVVAVLPAPQTQSTPSPTLSPADASVLPQKANERALLVANAVDVSPTLSKGIDNRILSSAWSPDEKYVVTSAYGSPVRFWSTTNWQPAFELASAYSEVQISSDGEWLLSMLNGNANVVEAKTVGKMFSFGNGNVTSVAFGPEGLVATGNYDGTVELWTYSGALLAVMRSHSYRVTQVAFSNDGRWIVSLGDDKVTRVWDTGMGATETVMRGLEGKDVVSFMASPDGKVLITTGGDDTIRIWEASTGKELHVINNYAGAFHVVFSPNSKLFLTVDKRVAHVWDVDGNSISALKRRDNSETEIFVSDGISEAAFSPDGKMVFTIYGDGDVTVWDTASGKALFRPSDPLAEDKKPRKTDSAGQTALEPPSSIGVVVAAFSPDGGLLVTAHNKYVGQILRVWDTRTWRKLFTLRPDKRGDKAGYFGDPKQISFSPDDKLVVTTDTENGETRVWDVRAGRVVYEPALPGGKKINRAKFGTDGSFLLTVGEGSTADKWELRRWDVATWRSFVIAEFRAFLIDFSSDWKFAVDLNKVGVYEVIELSTGLPLAELPGPKGPLSNFVFTSDSKLILTTGFHSPARIYPCELCGSSQDLLGIARRRLDLTKREFTKEEELKYLQGLPPDTAAATRPSHVSKMTSTTVRY